MIGLILFKEWIAFKKILRRPLERTSLRNFRSILRYFSRSNFSAVFRRRYLSGHTTRKQNTGGAYNFIFAENEFGNEQHQWRERHPTATR